MQEGHTAHATEARKPLGSKANDVEVYAELQKNLWQCRNQKERKQKSERFAEL